MTATTQIFCVFLGFTEFLTCITTNCPSSSILKKYAAPVTRALFGEKFDSRIIDNRCEQQ